MKLADVSIKRPVFATMMISALVVLGIFSYPQVGVNLLPNVDFPVITVTAIYPGADPSVIGESPALDAGVANGPDLPENFRRHARPTQHRRHHRQDPPH